MKQSFRSHHPSADRFSCVAFIVKSSRFRNNQSDDWSFLSGIAPVESKKDKSLLIRQIVYKGDNVEAFAKAISQIDSALVVVPLHYSNVLDWLRWENISFSGTHYSDKMFILKNERSSGDGETLSSSNVVIADMLIFNKFAVIYKK